VPAVERRPAAVADEPFLRALYASTRPEVAGWPDEPREAFLAQQFDAQRTGWGEMFPDSRHDVIVVGERPVGRVWVHWPAAECLIVDLALLPEHRRQGIGTQVVEELLVDADRAGVPARAHVERTNTPSLAFWTRLGFREVAGDALFIEIERPVGAPHKAPSSSSNRSA
jgi:ribosomal protein S18 acetylase RimI-like enzyme